jgi:hypothetical protein
MKMSILQINDQENMPETAVSGMFFVYNTEFLKTERDVQ